jgi:hypothetical protein
MIPASFDNFLLAIASAGAALIGLLFVAISVRPQHFFGARAEREHAGVATSAFTTLINGFFIAAAALLPEANVGGVTVALATIGLFTTARLGWQLVGYRVAHRVPGQHLGLRIVRSLALVLGSLGLYGYELVLAIQILRSPRDIGLIYSLCILLLIVYGVGLSRAWQLLGAPRSGLLGWLNPLADLDEMEQLEAEPPAPPETRAGSLTNATTNATTNAAKRL